MADDSSGRRKSRSRSPPRRPKKSGGFRWKDTNRDSRDNHNSNRYDYRSSDRRADRRSRSRSPPGRGDRGRHSERDTYRARHDDRGQDDRRHDERPRDSRRQDPDRRGRDSDKASSKPKKDKKAAAPAMTTGVEMIVVNVNDRLGSKTAVPCLPSDTVGQFKLMVAARIGRDAGQIMLRRQGERPFKDHITLEDYGISNGVQLDLEIDTGD